MNQIIIQCGIFLVVVATIIPRIHLLFKTQTALILEDMELGLWNFANWIGEVAASSLSLFVLYVVVALIETVAEAKGRAARKKLFQHVLRWLLYAAAVLGSGFITQKILLEVAQADRSFAFLSNLVVILTLSIVVSIVEFPEYRFDRLIRGTKSHE
jgi:cytochrome bd-type quinol oxidase subunit 2